MVSEVYVSAVKSEAYGKYRSDVFMGHKIKILLLVGLLEEFFF